MRVSRRKLEALRNLAARPGTEAEGRLASELLKKLEAKQTPAQQVYAQFETFLRTGSLDDLADAVGGDQACWCGSKYQRFGSCFNLPEHNRIRKLIQEKFPRGMRVYYNRWAYAMNCQATVVGYPKETSGEPNWIRVKFDHLKNNRNIPIYDAERGWYLFDAPMDADFLSSSGLRGGMENFDKGAPDEWVGPHLSDEARAGR